MLEFTTNPDRLWPNFASKVTSFNVIILRSSINDTNELVCVGIEQS